MQSYRAKRGRRDGDRARSCLCPLRDAMDCLVTGADPLNPCAQACRLGRRLAILSR